MFRLRRYRIFLVFSVFVLGTLYYFTTFGDLDSAGATSVEGLKHFGHKETVTTPLAPESPVIGIQKLSGDDDQFILSSSPTIPPTTTVSASSSPLIPAITSSPALAQAVEEESVASTQSIGVGRNDQRPLDGQDELSNKIISVTPTSADFTPQDHGKGKLDGISDVRETAIHWSKLPEHFPVPSSSIIPLPTGKPKAIPKIQHVFSDESANDKIDRLQKLEAIKGAFMTSWIGYKEKAWMQDELSPVTGSSRNPFCGWAATLVDTLDTLWIMGLKEEFENATNAVKNIDFTTSNRQQIPLFETVIRYLGGLIAAYDLSSGTYRVLLDKAVELADVLMSAFDTPNRMPMTFFPWKPTFASQPHRAQSRVVLAELGSLSVEFTRLAQITRQSKYYDAIARITQEFEAWQNKTKLPGLWPMQVDASGCKKPDIAMHTPVDHSLLNGPGVQAATPSDNNTIATESSNPTDSQIIEDASGGSSLDSKEATVTDAPDTDASVKSKEGVVKRQLSDETVEEHSPSAKADLEDMPDCEAQGLASPPGSTYEDFTLGGQADSVYEYLPKQYMLLGGLEGVYQSMYEMAMETTKKYLFFRPMLPDNRNVLLSGLVRTTGELNNRKDLVRKPEGTHLSCFLGGMVAIGAKIFDRESDLDIARKLTDGCVWAYEVTTTGIMPEHYLAAPCRSQEKCPWNETRYHELLDPYRASREKQRIEQEERRLQVHLDGENSRAAQRTEQFEGEAITSQADIPIESEAAEKVVLTTAQADSPKESGKVEKGEAVAAQADSPKESGKVEKGEAVAAQADIPKDLESEKAEAIATAHADVSKESKKPTSETGTIVKRQLGNIENELPLKKASEMSETPKENPPKSKEPDGEDKEKVAEESKKLEPQANQTVSDIDEAESSEYTYNPPPIVTPEEFVKARIKDERLPPGMTRVTGPRYILRPEAIESVFIMYRITGESYWREKGWQMFEAINKHTAAKYGASAIDDVTSEKPKHLDEMESFWLAETLKYFFLLFSDPSVINLDDYVLNTEAHPFKRPK